MAERFKRVTKRMLAVLTPAERVVFDAAKADIDRAVIASRVKWVVEDDRAEDRRQAREA